MTAPDDDDFPDPLAFIITIRRSGNCEAQYLNELDDPQDIINALRETAGTLELELREASGEFDTDLNDGDEDE